MSEGAQFMKRLIEVDLPIRKISEHARREKLANPPGYISTLHIWWARRPLAACRAVLCAALWPDPADESCPNDFRQKAAAALYDFAEVARTERSVSERIASHWSLWQHLQRGQFDVDDQPARLAMREVMLAFIADFADWKASKVENMVALAQQLTLLAHRAAGGGEGTRPLVIDPFAGGGTIPLEALRVGADAFASDLNPVPVLLNKVVLEYIPRFGARLAEGVEYWGQWIRDRAAAAMADAYPSVSDGSCVVAYLWARTVRCEGPDCGIEVPLIRSLLVSKRRDRSVALRFVPNANRRRIDIELVENPGARDVAAGTVRRGAATCPACGFTTAVERVRAQLLERRGGAADARLLCVVYTQSGRPGRHYRLPNTVDFEAIKRAKAMLVERKQSQDGRLSTVPDESISLNELRRISVPLYGMTSWGDIFAPRQALALSTFVHVLRDARRTIAQKEDDTFADALATCLALVIDRQADSLSSLASWRAGSECQRNTFGRQALPMVWDFAEVNPFSDTSGNWLGAVEWVRKVCEAGTMRHAHIGHVERASATHHPLPDDSAHAFITDPPYYDAVPYAHLSDFFYVWLRRSLGDVHPALFAEPQVPKAEEIVVDRPHKLSSSKKGIAFYERELTKAFAEARRVVAPGGIGTIVFASKSTSSWEAVLRAVVEAGWVITGSWPIDTEREARVAAVGQARLGSSIHLVCRPRESSAGLLSEDVGAWSTVLSELPVRIREWLPRLSSEGVVGADAIFACLGPALEIYSRYARVERVSGDVVPLGDYLLEVWAAVSREALSMVFEGADPTGLDADARVTAMWLWTLAVAPGDSVDDTEVTDDPALADDDADDEHEGDESETATPTAPKGFVLEFDAARKIAQGLGARLEELGHVIEIRGDKARLLPVTERAGYLFAARRQQQPAASSKRTSKKTQMRLFADVELATETEDLSSISIRATDRAVTLLDRIHQAMLLFAAGRGEVLRRFLVEEGIGARTGFWQLAQALSALYPTSTDEKRWIDGVLARKKGLSF